MTLKIEAIGSECGKYAVRVGNMYAHISYMPRGDLFLVNMGSGSVYWSSKGVHNNTSINGKRLLSKVKEDRDMYRLAKRMRNRLRIADKAIQKGIERC